MWKRAVICSFVCVVVLRIHGCGGGEQETGSARLGFAILKCRGTIGRGRLKDSWYAIARTQAQRALVSDEGDTRFQRQVIEEFHHGIYHGLESAYPSVFGSSSENSELAIAIRDSFGNCELSGICAPAENCEHYQCECSNHDGSCNDAGQYNCRFNRGSCDGAFHYSAPSCGPGSCLMTEGFYHAWTAAYGYNCGGRDLSNEWELCDRDEFMANSHVEKLRKLVMGLSESQAVHGYNLPSRLPDGVYNVRGEESPPSKTTTVEPPHDETHSSLPQCPDPDSVGIPEGCDPESTTADNLDKCLPQKALIFGISIRGAADVPDWAFTYASNVLAQYLDSDMDGVADDDKLVAALQSSGGWFTI